MINPQTQSHLYGFDRNKTHSLGTIVLSIRIGPYNAIMEFNEVDVDSPHNVILGRSWLHMMEAILPTYHQLVRYPTLTGTIDLRGDQAMSRATSAIVRKNSGWKPRATKAVSNEDLVGPKAISPKF